MGPVHTVKSEAYHECRTNAALEQMPHGKQVANQFIKFKILLLISGSCLGHSLEFT